METVRDGEGWVRTASHLRQIGLALRDYQEQHGTFPPAVVRGKGGQPLYSWRVLILPYLDEMHVYKRFHLDEPWDSPHNQSLLKPTPRCYMPGLGFEDTPGLTRHQVFIGPGTAFEREGLTLADFPDGLEKTILVAEAAEPVPWSQPEDLAYDPAQPLPRLGGLHKKRVHFLCYDLWGNPGFVVCFADGSPRFIRSSTDEKTIRSLITRNGGEPVDLLNLD
jgi:hypothetical protein